MSLDDPRPSLETPPPPTGIDPWLRHGWPWHAMARHGPPWLAMASHGWPWPAVAGHGQPLHQYRYFSFSNSPSYIVHKGFLLRWVLGLVHTLPAGLHAW